jgi:hypothetical protein
MSHADPKSCCAFMHGLHAAPCPRAGSSARGGRPSGRVRSSEVMVCGPPPFAETRCSPCVDAAEHDRAIRASRAAEGNCSTSAHHDSDSVATTLVLFSLLSVEKATDWLPVRKTARVRLRFPASQRC